MKNIILAFDKFKHTASAQAVTGIVLQSLANISDKFILSGIPLADGGEGTADILSKFDKSDKISLKVHDPLHRIIKASYYFSVNRIAYIDLASASGLELLKETERNPLQASTFGTGELIKNAVEKGANKIIIACGGSATNDAGIGALTAMGFEFYDHSGIKIIPAGENLIHITDCQFPKGAEYSKVHFTILSDVTNEFHGKNGAAFVYAAQKGASASETAELDLGLNHFATFIKNKVGIDISNIPGTGAAGGFPGSFRAFLDAELRSGSETVLDLVRFDEIIRDADMIITGEGRFDKQSLQGKITGKVMERAFKQDKPVVVLCGSTELKASETKFKNLQAIIALFEEEVTLEKAKKETEKRLRDKAKLISNMF